ncbi:MAG: HlyD family efflux transporter periplasmic adaptor subunit [Planctomycetaceae bacterium]|nr:HlyD family efflux transporter periplasmic adaptor subunit [Planctomycetaceae bacterium]
MSGDSSPQQKLEQFRRRCDLLLDESLTLEAFARDAVEAMAQIEGDAAACVVEFQNNREYRILAGYGLNNVSVDGVYTLDPDHVSLLVQSLRQQKTIVVTDRAVPEAGLKNHSAVISPLPGTQFPVRTVEMIVFSSPLAEQAAHLKEMTETFAQYFARYQEEQDKRKIPHTTEDFWKQFDLFMLKLQSSLDLKQAIAVAVNDGRTLIDCDRVSIALKYGNRTRVYGISGQEGVQHRANLVQSMAKVADTIIRLGTPVTYRGTIDDLPPELEKPLAEYRAESRTRMVKMIPLREPLPLKTDDDDDTPAQRAARGRRVMGCLLVEQATEVRPKPAVVERTELLTEHIENAIHNCEQHESIFLLPLWRLIGKTLRWFKGRRLWTAIAIVAGLILLSLALWLVPWDYRVEANGQAMPVIQHEVFAPWDGDVEEIFVESGQEVHVGDPLLKLVSDDLDVQQTNLESEILEKRKAENTFATALSEALRAGDKNQAIRAEGELLKTRAELSGAEAELKKIVDRIEKLTVKSPADGVVATFQLRQLLQNRPVRRGELLLEVMQPDGPWHLELEVPEYRMGHLMTALHKSENLTLPVEYVLATQVETSHVATMTEVATRSNESEEEGTVFEVYASIDPADLPTRNIGSEVTAKINCGPKSLFYVLFGDVVEFLQRVLWF